MQLTEIEIEIGGEAILVSVTKATMCRDVIHMVIRAEKDEYAVFESSQNVERVMSSDTKILKHVRSWGVLSGSYTLAVKPFDKVTSKMAPISRAKRKLQRMRSAILRDAYSANKKLQTTLRENMDHDVTKVYNKHPKNTRVPPSCTDGSFDIMKRFIRDTEIFHADDVEDMTIVLPPRTSGDGMELSCELPPRTRGDGIDSDDDLWDVTCVERCDMDAAFISEESCTSEVSELNQCIIYDNEITSDYESAFSDCSSVCDLERNVYADGEISSDKLTHLRTIFSDGNLAACVNCAVRERYMNTVIETDGQSDEGLGSMGSDVLV